MVRIALCLYGKYNNRFSENSGRDGLEYIKNKILKNNNVDIFIHSWDLQHGDEIQSILNDKIIKSVYEEQIDFGQVVKNNSIDESIFNPPGGENFRTVNNSLSFFYSRAKSIEMKKKYEEEIGKKYDICVCSRFDLGQMDKYVGFQDYRVSEMYLNSELDMDYVYSAMWNQLNDGFADMWFYSSSENMNKFIEMYEKSLQYYKKDSHYIKTLTAGWPDSNSYDHFSNEMFNSNKGKSIFLRKYKLEEAHNNHILHKWFIIESGLYNKCRFLEPRPSEFAVLLVGENKKKKLEKAFGSLNYTLREIENELSINNEVEYLKKIGCHLVLVINNIEILNKSYNYIDFRMFLDFLYPNKYRRFAPAGFNFAIMDDKEQCRLKIPLLSYSKIKISLFKIKKEVLVYNTIWNIEYLLSNIRDNKVFAEGRSIYLSDNMVKFVDIAKEFVRKII